MRAPHGVAPAPPSGPGLLWVRVPAAEAGRATTAAHARTARRDDPRDLQRAAAGPDLGRLCQEDGDVVITFLHYTICGTDDRVEHVQNVTREHLDLGVLSLYQQNGEMAPEEHLGSWPLVNIRSWQRKDPRAAR